MTDSSHPPESHPVVADGDAPQYAATAAAAAAA
eukprot:CAMPEP_0197601626 /NCGR_PEP_ID=MMETSP1326-20131121/35638_1 /TAXON_ID=1155430 /ORGANISM="Genus nov. species nov., Strain RCC2288" /LENGTH=32 /DNA_ID= /DNA_START= /DNA_END= /DNA_ORIENTATION=